MTDGYTTASGRRISEILAAAGSKRLPLIGKGLYREGQGIMSQSRPLVPVLTGALRASGYVDEPVIEGAELTGQRVSVKLGYGGVASKVNPVTGERAGVYALPVHENLEAFHHVGMAKYLEVPFNAARRGMGERLADFVAGKIGESMSDYEAPDVGLDDILF